MPAFPAPRVYPFADLMAASGFTQTRIQRRTHASGRDIRTAVVFGCTPSQADRWAVDCGLHPGSVWPHLWWNPFLEPIARLFPPLAGQLACEFLSPTEEVSAA